MTSQMKISCALDKVPMSCGERQKPSAADTYFRPPKIILALACLLLLRWSADISEAFEGSSPRHLIVSSGQNHDSGPSGLRLDTPPVLTVHVLCATRRCGCCAASISRVLGETGLWHYCMRSLFCVPEHGPRSTDPDSRINPLT